MAAKKPTKKTTLDTILTTVERGFAAVADDIADIRQTMATKEDIATVNKTLDQHTSILGTLTAQATSIERELKTIRRDLNDLMDKFENVAGYRKEIDHALGRIAAIEKHLGLDKKTASSHSAQ